VQAQKKKEHVSFALMLVLIRVKLISQVGTRLFH